MEGGAGSTALTLSARRRTMIGESKTFLEAVRLIDKIARFDVPVRIEGETGTGKEIAAREIHYRSPRHAMPFVPVNCGAIPDALIENELFGHRKGAYTDAHTDSPGVLSIARGGTLFLDEVDTLSAKGQVLLLRFLQDQSFRPLGAQAEERTDVRVIAASNRNLQQLAESGVFRIDLFFRLNLMLLEMPPLRQREGDPVLLARHFINMCSVRFKLPEKHLHPESIAWFGTYAWPGNVRELENIACREFLLTEGRDIFIPCPVRPRHANETLSDRGYESFDYRTAKAQALLDFDRCFLTNLMKKSGGNITKAALLAGKERRALGKLLKRNRIEADQFRDA
jgi:two-component system response regulator GlrR